MQIIYKAKHKVSSRFNRYIALLSISLAVYK